MQEPTLLFQDAKRVVVNKPAGWVVHPAGTDAPDLLSWIGTFVELRGWAPVHRLDVGTSGVVLFAVDNGMDTLANWFATREVEKHYRALVYGATREKGTLRRALKDARKGGPIEAETRYRTLESFGKWSLLDVRPVTGRKHQIRRHLQGMGHAIIGDDRYLPRGKPTVPAFPGRIWLHCHSIGFPDGTSYEAPLPPELEAHLAVLRARSPAQKPG